MTDIFARKPLPLKPGSNLPSLRYELFIKKIELEVVAAQSRIKALEAMELTYNLVRDALEACRLPNDTSLGLASNSVSVEMTALPTDALAMFAPLAREIGDRLARAGLHPDGLPSVGSAGHSPIRTHRWMLTTKGYQVVTLAIELPEKGLRDCRVIRVPRTYTLEEYKLEPLDGSEVASTQHEESAE
jgi:hypothetical protein